MRLWRLQVLDRDGDFGMEAGILRSSFGQNLGDSAVPYLASNQKDASSLCGVDSTLESGGKRPKDRANLAGQGRAR